LLSSLKGLRKSRLGFDVFWCVSDRVPGQAGVPRLSMAVLRRLN